MSRIVHDVHWAIVSICFSVFQYETESNQNLMPCIRDSTVGKPNGWKSMAEVAATAEVAMVDMEQLGGVWLSVPGEVDSVNPHAMAAHVLPKALRLGQDM